MRLLRKIKCALTTKQQLKQFYKGMTKEELTRRKQRERNIFWSASVSWATALGITLWAAKMDGPLLVLYAGCVMGVLIAQWADFRNKLRLIDAALALK